MVMGYDRRNIGRDLNGMDWYLIIIAVINEHSESKYCDNKWSNLYNVESRNQ